MSDQEIQDPLELPSLITPEWIAQSQAVIEKSTWKGASALQEILPKQTLISILQRTERLVFQEAALVEVGRIVLLFEWIFKIAVNWMLQ